MIHEFQCVECNQIEEYNFLWKELEKILKDEKDKWGYILYICTKCQKETKQYKIMRKAPDLHGVGYVSMETYWSKHPEIGRKHTEEMLKRKADRNEILKKKINQQPLPEDGDRKRRHQDYGPNSSEERLKIN